MIFEGSRYEHSDVVRVVAADGVARQTVIPTDNISGTSFQFSYYTVQDGDRMDVLAQRFLGDPELWWVIADHNPEKMFYDYLAVGSVLRIPSGLGTG